MYERASSRRETSKDGGFIAKTFAMKIGSLNQDSDSLLKTLH